ncbi:hypothetical protein I7I50_04607 [Histoplasma capsulatum G186AR]|uniref:Uncharacterized protein n=1 Tax=Ajellomyces capsulatus TaxID=5037 RepID=A0A8H7YQQ9_AJECA|nr:hypothetical protein I7I52_05516 [Histoplasma capsulatum]QSS75467.1 hypothetical protein I7I50_04607 [Histoplasma capsulatum G186AR]
MVKYSRFWKGDLEIVVCVILIEQNVKSVETRAALSLSVIHDGIDGICRNRYQGRNKDLSRFIAFASALFYPPSEFCFRKGGYPCQ